MQKYHDHFVIITSSKKNKTVIHKETEVTLSLHKIYRGGAPDHVAMIPEENRLLRWSSAKLTTFLSLVILSNISQQN